MDWDQECGSGIEIGDWGFGWEIGILDCDWEFGLGVGDLNQELGLNNGIKIDDEWGLK